jgi:type I restriction enzyme S subunit
MSIKKLSDYCKFVSGGTPSKNNPSHWKGEIPWFSPKDFKSFDLVDSKDHISQIAANSSSTKLLASGTILVVIRSGVLAHSLPVGVIRQAATFNQDIKAIIPNNEIDSEYVALFLRANEHKIIRNGVKRGATVHSLNSGYLENLPFNIIELPEQRRIARESGLMLGMVAKSYKAARLQWDETANLAYALIFESIKKGRTQKYTLGEVLEEEKNGVGETWASFPVLGATRAGLALAKEPPGKTPQRYKPVTPGTVFYNPMRILIGSIAFLDDDDDPGITSPDYVVLRGKPGVVDSRWFYYWLRSPLGEQTINSLARGAVRERMLFNRLAEGEIELPDFAVQQKTSQALAAIKPMRAAIKKQMQELELMPQKILAQVFES